MTTAGHALSPDLPPLPGPGLGQSRDRGENPDRVWLVGVLNPYGGDLDLALVNYPSGCSGHRLWRILGVEEDRYLSFRRVNLCADRWSRSLAIATAYQIYDEIPDPGPASAAEELPLVVLLGVGVADAFRGIVDSGRLRQGHLTRGPSPLALWQDAVDAAGRARWVCLPHPSGANQSWNCSAVARARTLLAGLAPRVPWGDALLLPRARREEG